MCLACASRPALTHGAVLFDRYEDAAKKLALFVPFLRVDCGVQATLCESYGITTYPTVVYFVNGKVVPMGEGVDIANAVDIVFAAMSMYGVVVCGG